jgi:uncharacterized protein YxjI
MKKTVAMILMVISLISCITPNTRRNVVPGNTTIPIPEDYLVQKAFTFRQNIADIVTSYSVTEFGQKKFSVRQEANLVSKKFQVKNLSNEVTYTINQEPFQEIVIEGEVPDTGRTYTISQGNTAIASVVQVDKNDFLELQLLYKGRVYPLQGAIGRKANNYFNCSYYLLLNDQEIASFYRQFHYFENRWEVRINQEFNQFENEMILALNLVIDQIVREYGFLFKN